MISRFSLIREIEEKKANALLFFLATGFERNGMRADENCFVLCTTVPRAGGHHNCKGEAGQQFNGSIHVVAKVIKNVMASAIEAEIAAMPMGVVGLPGAHVWPC